MARRITEPSHWLRVTSTFEGIDQGRPIRTAAPPSRYRTLFRKMLRIFISSSQAHEDCGMDAVSSREAQKHPDLATPDVVALRRPYWPNSLVPDSRD